jgi:hypothetical protein
MMHEYLKERDLEPLSALLTFLDDCKVLGGDHVLGYSQDPAFVSYKSYFSVSKMF